MAKGGGTNVGGIYGGLELDNSGFKGVLQQSEKDMAKAALAMQSASRVKVDVAEWKRLSSQMQALKVRAQETRVALLATPAGSAEAKKLQGELKGLEQRVRLLKSATEPTRKELERLAKAEKDVGAASGGSKFGAALDQGKAGVTSKLGGMLGGAVASGNPYVIAAAAALAALSAEAAAAVVVTEKLASVTFRAAESNGAWAEQILNASQKTAMSTTKLQELKMVADITGVSYDAIIRNMTIMERKLPEMAKGSGAAADTMRQLGIAVTGSDGHLRNMDQLFPAVIRKLQEMKNLTERNAIGAQLFGRGWSELAPIFGMTAREFDAMVEKAHSLGLVLSGEELQAASALDDQFDELRAGAAGLMRQLGTAVTPYLLDAMQDIAAKMPGWIEDAKQWFDEIGPSIGDMAADFGELWDKAQPFVETIAELTGEAILGGLETINLAFDKMSDFIDATKTAVEPLLDLLRPVADAFEHILMLMGLAGGIETTKEMLPYRPPKAGRKGGFGEPEETTAPNSPADPNRGFESAVDRYVELARDVWNKQKNFAREMVDSMRGLADETVGIVRDQLEKEKALRDKAADDAKSRYEKLAELGRAGVAAMTNVRMFSKKPEDEKELTAVDFSSSRIAAAAKELLAKQQNQAEIQALVGKQLYGNSISRYERMSSANDPNWDAVKGKSDGTLLENIAAAVSVLPRLLIEVQKANRPVVSTGIRG